MKCRRSNLRSRNEVKGHRVVVCRNAQNRYQLISGWRRITVLQQLAQEQGGEASTITARLTGRGERRIDLYIDMVESNLLRQQLSFAELAQLALTAAADPELADLGVEGVVSQLYASLPKMKRSYIRSFVYLLENLGSGLRYPKEVSRNQGVAVSRTLRLIPETVPDLREQLAKCATGAEQVSVLKRYLENSKASQQKAPTPERQFQLGKTHVTGRQGECLIRTDFDFASVNAAVLFRAIRAFEQVLRIG